MKHRAIIIFISIILLLIAGLYICPKCCIDVSADFVYFRNCTMRVKQSLLLRMTGQLRHMQIRFLCWRMVIVSLFTIQNKTCQLEY